MGHNDANSRSPNDALWKVLSQRLGNDQDMKEGRRKGNNLLHGDSKLP